MDKREKKGRPRTRTVTINLTCPLVLYESGRLEWERRGYKGPADVFQTALRKLTNTEVMI